jgi:uncharacterized SAM-binding protein YcdF (DUF218 family)
MKKYKGYIICIAISLIVGIIFKFILKIYNFLGYASFAVALVSAYYMVLRVYDSKNHKLCHTLNKLATYCIWIFLFAFGVTITVIAGDTKTDNNENADYAIVLGAGVDGTEPSRSLKARLNAALTYAENNPDTIFILSGGKGSGEEITEAQCMKNYLTDNGIDENRLILEENATNTYQNIKNSGDIILSIDPDFDGTICVITEIYHVTRAKLCAEDMGFPVVVSQSGFNGFPVLTANYFVREVFALWNYMIFVR